MDLGPLTTTTILVNNIHCASCVSHIEALLLEAFDAEIQEIRVNIISHEVTVLHLARISGLQLCHILDDAAFEVYGAQSAEKCDTRMLVRSRTSAHLLLPTTWSSFRGDLPRSTSTPIINANLGCWSLPAPAIELFSSTFPTAFVDRPAAAKRRHAQHCDACKAEGYRDSICQIPEKETNEIPVLQAEKEPYEAILSIGGMTCASCTGAVEHAVEELPFVRSIQVTLLTNSAAVVLTDQSHLQDVVDTIEDLGYDCRVETCQEESTNTDTRIISLTVAGFYCEHCPPKVAASLMNSGIDILESPTIESPIIRLCYRPGTINIRRIVQIIQNADSAFSVELFVPPSLEDRSQAMQRHEQARLLIRLVFVFLVGIPTLLIGVIFMDLLVSTSPLRRFFEQPLWTGAVRRQDWALFILATPVMFYGADVFHVRAFKEIRALWRRTSRVPIAKRFYRFGSMNLLISAGTCVAYLSSLGIIIMDATTTAVMSRGSSTYFDSVVFLTFFILLGRWLESYSKAKTGNAVSLLKDLKSSTAILMDPEPMQISSNFLEVGDTVLIHHGASPPADGSILDANAKFDESSLTGESKAAAKGKGDKIYAGSINVGSPVRMCITDVGTQSMLDQIIAVVREGQTRRAPVEQLVDVLTSHFVPLITVLAIATWIIWLSLGKSGRLDPRYLNHSQGGWAFWSLEFAIAVFVVACPCGIGLAAPTALFVGSGLAAKHGLLVRGGGEAFQTASNIDAVVFDKTGTLTEGGAPRVSDHLALFPHRSVLWAITGALEAASSHPIARAIQDLVHLQSLELQIQDEPCVESNGITETPGCGLCGTFRIGDNTYEAAIGSEKFVQSICQPSIPEAVAKWKREAKSVALVALKDDKRWSLAAAFAISDPLRPSAAPTIAALQSRKMQVYMLTGDNSATAASVAALLNIPQDHVFAEVLPIEKADKIRLLQRQYHAKGDIERGNPRRARTVAFVGDGINDAPALTAADVSVSFSTASEIAMQSSSFILLNVQDPLKSVVLLLDLSRIVFRRVKFNFAWAIIYNAILVPVAAGVFFATSHNGWRLSPVWGSAAMAASSLCVILSSLALRWQRLG